MTPDAPDFWEELGACHGSGEEFVEVLTPAAAQPLVASYCDRCPVEEKCFHAALDMPLRPWGVWGGRLFGPTNRQPIDLRLETVHEAAS